MRSKRKATRDRHVKSGLIQFARNGRWGTCSGCPRDENGLILPELCEYTQRYDHNLTKSDLYGLYERTKKKYNVLVA